MIFSPSSTIKWKKCPQEYAYYKLGVQPRLLGPINYGGMFGSAMSAAMEVIHRPGNVKPDPKMIADAWVTSNVTEFRSYGASLEEAKIDEILKLLGPTIDKYIEAYPPLFEKLGWKVVASEWTIPNSGNSRIDLLCIDRNSNPIIIDAKWKRSVVRAEYEQQAIDDYQHDWKMKHYCHFAGLHYNRPVLNYYIMLGIASPKFKLQVIPYSVSPREMQLWEASAAQAWQDMSDTARPVTQAADHKDRYGLCPYYDLCFQYDGDYVDVGSIQYIQIQPTKKEASV